MSTATLPRVFDAVAVVSKARELGITLTVRGSVVDTFQRFPAGDARAYTAAEGDAYTILDMVPLRGGSVWGTTSDGIGGHVGMSQGYMRLHKSGTGARVLSALSRAIASGV